MAVMETPDDRWRDVGVRLTAAAALVDQDLGGGRAPSPRMGGYVLETGRQVVERLEAVATRIGGAHRAELDEATLERLRAAVRQLRATNQALAGLADLLDPPHNR
jgi:hypothetical protein